MYSENFSFFPNCILVVSLQKGLIFASISRKCFAKSRRKSIDLIANNLFLRQNEAPFSDFFGKKRPNIDQIFREIALVFHKIVMKLLVINLITYLGIWLITYYLSR